MSQDTKKHTADTRNPEWDNYSPEGHGRTDEQIRADIHEALRNSDAAASESLSLSVGDGIVTLSGRVENSEQRRRITDLVKSVPSVKEVQDQLQVD